MPKGKKNVLVEQEEEGNTEIVGDRTVIVEETRVVELPTEFRVNVKNHCAYPVRVLLCVDEKTGHSTYSVFKSFESRALTINLLTYRYLQRDPKVHMSKVDG